MEIRLARPNDRKVSSQNLRVHNRTTLRVAFGIILLWKGTKPYGHRSAPDV